MQSNLEGFSLQTGLFSLPCMAEFMEYQARNLFSGKRLSPYIWWLAAVKEAALTLLLFLSKSQFKGKKPNPQQEGEGAGAQRQFPAAWYNLSPLTWASSGIGVSKLGSHHPLHMAGTAFGLGDEQREIFLQLSQCCNEVTLSPPSFSYLFSWHFSERQRICFPFAVLLLETVIALWTFRSRKPIKGPRGQGFSASQHIP